MFKKIMFVILVASAMLLQGPNLWADDDAIMDVDDNAAAFSGTWSRSTFRILYYGDDYQYAVGSGGAATAAATFTTAQYADITGRYQVYVRWTAGTARATNARYNIYDDLNNYKAQCTYDQRSNGGVWMFCNEVTLNAGRRGRVIINNANVPTSRYVCADAVRFVRVSKDYNDIVDAPGYEVGSEGSLNFSGLGTCDIGSASWTRLRTITLSDTPTHGMILVRANGIVAHTLANQYVRVCIGDSGGCDSLAPYIQQSSTEISQVWARETRFAVNETYSPGGTKTFYLYACKSEFAGGSIMWDDFTAIYLPKRY